MTKRSTHEATAELWSLLDGDPAALADVTRVRRGADTLPSRLPVGTLGRATVAACALAAAGLAAARTGGHPPGVELDDGAVGAAFLGERLLRVDGEAPIGFAPLSGFWQAADGWVRTHANYPHHRDRLLAVHGLPADAGPDDLAAALRRLPAAEAQDRALAAGALTVAVRSADRAEATGPGPLLETARPAGADAPPRRFTPLPAGPLLPAHGLRVLDLTRTIAGPVATRTLALLGADVLRVDHPDLPDAAAHLDTGFGKRSTTLDLADPGDHAALERLLTDADVVVTGYRPGALDRFGLSPADLARRHPGLVVGGLSAWGRGGPWAGRRGFDSLVQAATGIAVIEGGPGDRPGALPCQALDHATGYLLAAALLRALTAQAGDGGTRTAAVSLAATAAWLTTRLPGGSAPDDTGAAFDPTPWLGTADAAAGRTTYALPAVRFADGPTDWATAPGGWGVDEAQWAALPRG